MAKRFLFFGVLVLALAFGAAPLRAEDAEVEEGDYEHRGTMTLLPLDYAFVEGDQHRYREHHWSQEGYEGGIENFEFEEHYIPAGLSASVDGHARIRNNDYEVNALLEKEDFGYVKLEYEEFSKYYDDMGGVYGPFSALSPSTLNRELEMEIGHFRIETGWTPPEAPHLIFAYERHFKDGAKSRLTWTPVTIGSLGRNIGPSFQYVDEIVDGIELRESHTLTGFELKGRQAWEWSEAELQREEQSLSTGVTASTKKIRVQEQMPAYHLFTTTESVERWFRDDSVFTGLAYHYLRIGNSEVENIFEMDENRKVTNFTNPKQIRDARAENEYNSHTWTANAMFHPFRNFSVTTNLRTEAMDRSGNSTYPSDSTPVAAGGAAPDGVINTTEISTTEDRLGRVGEGVSLRFTGIPRTAVYNELEFEQLRNWLSEDRDSRAGQSASSAAEIFGRETIASMSRGIWTLGFQTMIARWLNWTSHFRHNRSNTDYEDERETQPGATGAKSAFTDALKINTEELATRFSLRPKPWLKPSVRYQFQRTLYDTRVEDEGHVETSMNSHIFTFDLTFQPRHDLLIMTGVSPQYAWVVTPARFVGSGNTPRFQANLISWLLSLNYDLSERIGFLSGLNYSHASNLNDFADSGLPMAAAFHQWDASAGVSWKMSELLTLITEYGFVYYGGYDKIDGADYNGQLVSVRTKFDWG